MKNFLTIVTQYLFNPCFHHIRNLMCLHILIFLIRNRRQVKDLGAYMTESDIVEYLPRVYEYNRNDGALCHQCGFEAACLELLQVVAVVFIAAFWEDEESFAVFYTVCHFLDDADGLADVVNLERKTVAECEDLFQYRHICLFLIDNERTTFFVRVDNTAGIVFSLMVGEHDIAAILWEVFFAIGLGKNKSIDFDKTDNIAHDGVTMLRGIMFLVPDDMVHTEQVIDFMKDTDDYNIVKSKHKQSSFRLCFEPQTEYGCFSEVKVLKFKRQQKHYTEMKIKMQLYRILQGKGKI